MANKGSSKIESEWRVVEASDKEAKLLRVFEILFDDKYQKDN